ncbi:epimerase [Ruania halotolerans]|uniref:epimerase n=1 Tax=Ruania halotolerans TaxID=2897773 RepID=UPI001E64181E|nr:NAD-dependent epimerase/dehydratase family protein [Ruania halotolerans]UFU06666.1 NAD-dependent epimerase/dehydratase family protein [Ruania halotolerans]
MTVSSAPRVVIAGGTGFLGTALAAEVSRRGAEAVLLTRTPRPDLPYRQVRWDAVGSGGWAAELDGPDVRVANLAGKLVDCRPTRAAIAELRDSRVHATRALVQAAQAASAPVQHWLQASTTAIWSDGGEAHLTESSPVPDIPPGLPQMTGVAAPWEEAAAGAPTEHLHIMRISIVLGGDSPVLQRLMFPVRMGLGGPVGSGRQWFSWIHLTDWLELACAALGLGALRLPDGVLVAAAPNPVRNAELMAAMRRHVGRPDWAPPTPAPLVQLGSVVLRTDPALALTGRHVTSERLGDFEFRYPHLDGAIAALDQTLP